MVGMKANKGWVNAKPSNEQNAILKEGLKEGLKGGAIAYFNKKEGFGVKQSFKPGTFENLNLFWSPERIQINLEMTPNVKKLKTGKQASFAYEVRYLDKVPIK